MERILKFFLFLSILVAAGNRSMATVNVGAVEITDLMNDENDEPCLNCGIEISTENHQGEKLMVALYVLDNNGKPVKNENGKMMDPLIYSIRPAQNATHGALDIPIPISIIPTDVEDLKLDIIIADEAMTTSLYRDKGIVIPFEDIERTLKIKEASRMAVGVVGGLLGGSGGMFDDGNVPANERCYYCGGTGECSYCRSQAASERDCDECSNTGKCRYCGGSGRERKW